MMAEERSSNGSTLRPPKQHRISLWAIFLVSAIFISVLTLLFSGQLTGHLANDTNAINAGGGIESFLGNFVRKGGDGQSPGGIFSALLFGDNSNASAVDRLKGLYLDGAIANPQTPSINKLIDRSIQIEIPDNNRTLAFVHIGKSGGSTISLLLRNGCMSAVDGTPCEERRWEQYPGDVGRSKETIASQRIEFYLHTPHAESGKMADYYSRITSIVVVARDPFDRFVSAFLSRHPQNIDSMRIRNKRARYIAQSQGVPPPIWAKVLWGDGDVEQNSVYRAAFVGCYPNLEALANCSVGSSFVNGEVYNATVSWKKANKYFQKDISLNCKELCRDVATAESKFVHHIKWNYHAFLKDLPPSKEVLLIRTKQLWDDWVIVNNILGSTHNVTVPRKGEEMDTINARGGLPVKNDLSSEGKAIICDFLKEEYREYINLLNRAVNLSDEDIRKSLGGSMKNCPSILEALISEKS